MKKLLFISNIASPNQVKFCEVLQHYFDAEFWFYELASAKRPIWWDISLGPHSKILPKTYFKRSANYLSIGIIGMLNHFNPDTILLGGMFFPSNIITYFWARARKKDVYFVSETLRNYRNGLTEDCLIYSGFKVFLMKLLFHGAKGIIATNSEAQLQFRKLNIIPGDEVNILEYPNDIDRYFTHPSRNPTHTCTILFANRLVDKYNPILALKAFLALSLRNCKFRLLMNNEGSLKNDCVSFIETNKIPDVSFLDNVQSWDDLHRIYESADIFILPARFSNGNFSIIEAMASGLGIVISRHILGSGNYIESGSNGFKCDLTVESITAAIYTYLDNIEKFSSHAKKNRCIAENYTMITLAKKYHDLLG